MKKVNKAGLNSENSKQKGSPGVKVVGGYLLDDEKNPKLHGSSKYTEFSNMMLNLAVVGVGVRFFLNLVSSVDWRFDPSNPEDSRSVEFARKFQFIANDTKTPWHRIIRRAAMYRFYGYSIQEWTAKRNSEGNIGFLDIEPRPQSTIERWDISEHGDVIGIFQQDPNTYREMYLPRYKLVYVVDDSLSTSPEGFGLFRTIYNSSKRLERYLQLEGFGYEMDVRGIPIGRAPLGEIEELVRSGDLSEAESKKLLEPLEKVLKNHIKNPYLSLLLDSLPYQSEDDAATPSSIEKWNIEFAKSEVGAQESLIKSIQRETFYIAMVLGIDGLLIGSTNTGAYSLGQNKSSNLALIIDSTLKELVEIVQEDMIKPIWAMNGWDDSMMPKAATSKVQLKEVGEITSALRDLAGVGYAVDVDDPAVAAILNMLGLPKSEMGGGSEDSSLLGSSDRDGELES